MVLEFSTEEDASSAFNFKLQQYLPFTVLKPCNISRKSSTNTSALQQYLPFTVLKPYFD